jgi:hypothetical protein
MAWQVRFSNTKQKNYYFNPETGESRWEVPDDLDNEENEDSGEEVR